MLSAAKCALESIITGIPSTLVTIPSVAEGMTLTSPIPSATTYIVKAKAVDVQGAESDWATLEVTMPLNINDPSGFTLFDLLVWCLDRLVDRYPFLAGFVDGWI